MSGVRVKSEQGETLRSLCPTCPISAVCTPVGPLRLLESPLMRIYKCEQCGRTFWERETVFIREVGLPACGIISKSILSCGNPECDAALEALRRNVREAKDAMS